MSDFLAALADFQPIFFFVGVFLMIAGGATLWRYWRRDRAAGHIHQPAGQGVFAIGFILAGIHPAIWLASHLLKSMA